MSRFSTVIRLVIAGSAVVAGLLAITPATATPVLLGNGTFNTVNDLTIIQDGNQTLEFLDLTTTQGKSVGSALAAYGADGFRWAVGSEVASLYDAFGFTYGSIALSFVILDVPVSTASNFVNYLGATFGDAALGWIDDFTTDFYHTYSCISTITCTSNAFVENTGSFWPSRPALGVYLVRDQRLSTPEPGTVALFCLALAGLFARRLPMRLFSRLRRGRHRETRSVADRPGS